jgi:hypothetical protein
MRFRFALAVLSVAVSVGVVRADTSPQCHTCQDACAAKVHACYLDMCVQNGGWANDADAECHDVNPKKLKDYTAGYATCRTASAACQAKCVADKICTK